MPYDQTENSGGNILKGLAAGIIAGAVAAAVMNQFQKRLSKMITGENRSHGAQSLQPGTPDHGAGRMLEQRGKDDPNDDAAERLANTFSVGLTDHELDESTKATMGTLLHYGFGMSMGALYGAVAEFAPQTTAGAGTLFGAAVWLGADEGVTPMLGLSKSASEYPFSIHASAFASHIVYGLAAEGVRRAVRKVI